ncbi:hypothetical protein F5141DRAFT_1066116 [Pisolithus sp. B1]|nr:hypothetical protein F5141DRAFT_1066116 [Pisolithus sp. B1]
MMEKLLAALRDIHITQGIEVSDPQKVAWNQLLELMQKYHLTIINWPYGVSPPGPGFDHKKLKAGPLHQLIVPYLWRKLGHMYDGHTDDKEEQDSLGDVPEIEIKCWNQDIIDISDVSPLKGDIPLVKTANGTILWKVSDDPEWQKSCQEEDCQQQSTENLQHDMLPGHVPMWEPSPSQFPSQHEDSGNDCVNYRKPGPSNIPYNALPPAHHHFPPFCQGHPRIPSRSDPHLYYNAQPAAPQWVNRGSATPQYEDDFNGDYIDDYF